MDLERRHITQLGCMTCGAGWTHAPRASCATRVCAGDHCSCPRSARLVKVPHMAIESAPHPVFLPAARHELWVAMYDPDRITADLDDDEVATRVVSAPVIAWAMTYDDGADEWSPRPIVPTGIVHDDTVCKFGTTQRAAYEVGVNDARERRDVRRGD